MSTVEPNLEENVTAPQAETRIGPNSGHQQQLPLNDAQLRHALDRLAGAVRRKPELWKHIRDAGIKWSDFPRRVTRDALRWVIDNAEPGIQDGARGDGPSVELGVELARLETLAGLAADEAHTTAELVAASLTAWRAKDTQDEAASNHSRQATQPRAPLPHLKCHWEPSNEPLILWLVKKLIPQVGIGRISGQWGTFKTFMALHLAAMLMTEGEFLGRKVKRKGGVLFIAAEGHSQLNLRLAALCKKLNLRQEDLPFVSVGVCPRLLDKDAAVQLVAIAQEAAAKIRAKFDLPLVIVIIDTIAAAAGYGPGQEDDAGVAQSINKVMQTLAAEMNIFVYGLDHFGKAIETGTRGSSAKEDGIDSVLALLGDKSIAGKVSNTRVAVRKARDAPAGDEWPFKMDTVDLGVDEDRDPITSLVVNWDAPQEMVTKPRKKASSRSEKAMRDAINEALVTMGADVLVRADGPKVHAVEIKHAQAEFNRHYPVAPQADEAKAADAKRKAFERALDKLPAEFAMGEIEGVGRIWRAA